jgi:hypothetical protein
MCRRAAVLTSAAPPPRPLRPVEGTAAFFLSSTPQNVSVAFTLAAVVSDTLGLLGAWYELPELLTASAPRGCVPVRSPRLVHPTHSTLACRSWCSGARC